MGDRWIPPPYLRVGEGPQVVVEAKVYVLDAAGRPTPTAPAWQSFDRGMVTVTPGTGNEVELTVNRAGQTRLGISGAGASRRLVIRAGYPNGVIQVEISDEQ